MCPHPLSFLFFFFWRKAFVFNHSQVRCSSTPQAHAPINLPFPVTRRRDIQSFCFQEVQVRHGGSEVLIRPIYPGSFIVTFNLQSKYAMVVVKYRSVLSIPLIHFSSLLSIYSTVRHGGSEVSLSPNKQTLFLDESIVFGIHSFIHSGRNGMEIKFKFSSL